MMKNFLRVDSIVVFLLSFCFYLYYQRVHYFNPDEFVILVQARRVLDGQVPYRDFFQFIMPGSIYISAAWLKLAGDTIWSIKTFSALEGAFICLLVYLFATRIELSKRITYLIVLFTLSFCLTFMAIISHHWLSTITALISTYFMALFVRNGKRLLILFSGLFAGFTFLISQHKGFLIFIGLILFLLIDNTLYVRNASTIQDRFKKFLRYSFFCSISFLIPFFLLVIYLYKMDAINDFIYDTFFWIIWSYRDFNAYKNYFYIGNYYIYQVFTKNQFPLNLYHSRNLLLIGYLPPIILGLSIFHSIKILIREKDYLPAGKNLILLTITGILMFTSILYRSDHIHITFIFPFFLLLLGAFFQRWLRVWRTMSVTQKALISGILFLSYIYNVNEIGFLFRSINYFRYPINTRIGNFYTINEKGAYELENLFKNIENINEEQIFVYLYSPYFYYICGKTNPTRYDILIPGYNTDEQIKEVIETLEKKKVKFIIYDSWDRKVASEPLEYGYPEAVINLDNQLNKYIEQNFEVILEIRSFAIYKRRGD